MSRSLRTQPGDEDLSGPLPGRPGEAATQFLGCSKCGERWGPEGTADPHRCPSTQNKIVNPSRQDKNALGMCPKCGHIDPHDHYDIERVCRRCPCHLGPSREEAKLALMARHISKK